MVFHNELVWRAFGTFFLGSLFACLPHWKGFPGGSLVKNLPDNAGDVVWSLGGEDPLEKEMSTHSNILAWEIPWIEEPDCRQFTESQRVRHDLVTEGTNKDGITSGKKEDYATFQNY